MQRIPKKIHYCWFGGNAKPESVNKYIATWKKYCPDYQIIEWNEENFDILENDYCREAYESKKWAFVSDYARLKVLYDYGGIYMDSDVEMIKSLDEFLQYEAFSGYESNHTIPTGTMGCCAGNEWIGFLLQDYENRHFIKTDNSFDETTNTSVITSLTKEKYAFQPDGTFVLLGAVAIFPCDYFCAKSPSTGIVNVTNNTHTIHHFSGTWMKDDIKKATELHWKLVKMFGIRLGNIMYKIYDYPRHFEERINQMWEKHIKPMFLYK